MKKRTFKHFKKNNILQTLLTSRDLFLKMWYCYVRNRTEERYKTKTHSKNHTSKLPTKIEIQNRRVWIRGDHEQATIMVKKSGPSAFKWCCRMPCPILQHSSVKGTKTNTLLFTYKIQFPYPNLMVIRGIFTINLQWYWQKKKKCTAVSFI